MIERRYIKGVKNLFDIYINIVDGALIFDNSYGKHELIAQKIEYEDIVIINTKKYNGLKESYEQKR